MILWGKRMYRLKQFLIFTFLLLLGIINITLVSGLEESFPHAEHYAPSTTFLYTIRLDDESIETMNSVLDQAASGMAILYPELASAPTSIHDFLLDVALQDLDIDLNHPWIGDYLSTGVVFSGSLYDEINIIILDITDQEQARQYIESTLSDYTQSIDGDTITYDYIMNPTFRMVIITPENIIWTSNSIFVPSLRDARSLEDNEEFVQARDALAYESYGITMYLDVPTILDIALADGSLPEEDIAILESFVEYFQPATVGLTMVGDNSIVTDLGGLLNMKEDILIDTNLWERMAESPTLLYHSSNLSGAWELVRSTVQAADPLSALQMNLIIESYVQQYVGLDFQDDILSWLGGEFITYFHYDVPEIGEPTGMMAIAYPDIPNDNFGMDAGLFLEANNSSASKAVFESLADVITEASVENIDVSISQEVIGGADAFQITLLDETDPDFRFNTTMALDDEWFVLASPKTTQNFYKPQATPAETSPFDEVIEQYLPENPFMVYYIDGDMLTMIGDLATLGGTVLDPIMQRIDASLADQPFADIESFTDDELREMRSQIEGMQRYFRASFDIYHSFLFSGSVIDNGTAVFRAVLTLSD